jgi:hypothetical protein
LRSGAGCYATWQSEGPAGNPSFPPFRLILWPGSRPRNSLVPVACREDRHEATG